MGLTVLLGGQIVRILSPGGGPSPALRVARSSRDPRPGAGGESCQGNRKECPMLSRMSRDRISGRVGPIMLWAAVGLLLGGVTGCGGSQPPAEDPSDVAVGDDPDSGSQGGGYARPSSGEVQKGIDRIQAGDFQAAKEVLTAAHQASPEDPQAAYYLGVALEGLDESEAARAAYEKALANDPKLGEASVNLSAILLEAGEADKALEVIESGLGHAPEQPQLLENRGHALLALDRAEAAVQAFEAAQAKAPDNALLRFHLAQALATAGKKQEAVTQAKQAAAAEDPEVVEVSADLLGKLGDFGACVSALDRAIARKPSPALHVRRGLCRHNQKDVAGEKADYEAAKKLDPSYAPAYYYLGQLYKLQKKNQEARAECQKAVELGKDTNIATHAEKCVASLK